jgi:two-component system C4-dicarboxylate transport response regulator DctD
MGRSMPVELFLVDDDADVRGSVAQSLRLSGLNVNAYEGARQALADLDAGAQPLVIVSDVRMRGMSGLDLQRAVRARDAQLPVILITGHGDVPMAVQATREGAYDFIEKPFPPARILAAVQGALRQRRSTLEQRGVALAGEPEDAVGAQWGLVGRSAALREVRRLVGVFGAAAVPVLVTGETGTGKEVVARALHTASQREGPFVAVNCSAVPESIFESEMFGHEAGAFTGALKRRIGRIEHASRGTLFLDEIESMPMALQAKLLRVLQDRCVQRLGSNTEQPVDCRVVAATKVDLAAEAACGRFRADLYYRLNVGAIRLPALRERLEDLPVLLAHFIDDAARRLGVPAPAWGALELSQCASRAWPGNLRELRNAVDRWCLGVEGFVCAPAASSEAAAVAERGAAGAPSPASAATLEEALQLTERACIEEALRRSGGRVAAAADALGLSRKTLYEKLHRLGIPLPRTQALPGGG